MGEYELFAKIGRVEAPLGFEKRVLAELSLRKQKHVRTRRVRLVFAGACASLAVLLLVLNFGILSKKPAHSYSSLEKDFPPGFQRAIPITEKVNYSGEVRQRTYQPRTVYILEHVSDSTDTKIMY